MSSNPYKAFVSYFYSGNTKLSAEPPVSSDPSGGQWRTMGLVPPLKGETGLSCDLDGAGRLLAVQFNERILPGKVRDEHLAKVVAKVERDEGRSVSKKEYAQLREQAEFDLLPKAFIRRALVPIIFTGDFMLICTSSAKRADEAVAVLRAAFGETFKPQRVLIKNHTLGIEAILTRAAAAGQLAEFDDSYEGEVEFFPTDFAVLKGSNKKTIRIKDKPVEDGDIQQLLTQDYRITELGIRKGSEDKPDIEFIVTDMLMFKRVIVPDVKASGAKEDFFGFTVMCVTAYRRALHYFIGACGGKHVEPVVDEDDEL